jgi:glycosyltransferase involved in cell wall biosynthesis
MMNVVWREVVECSAWVVAGLWMWRTRDAIRWMPTLPDIGTERWDLMPPEDAPWLTVVIAARNEAENIGATLETLVTQQYRRLWVLAVDDRSTDQTPRIVDEFAARYPERIGAIHIEHLPEGWLGKTFALEVGARNSGSEYVLFTDGDVMFSPSSLRRAMACAVMTEADHLVVMPTPLVKSRGEGIVLGFLQVAGIWMTRPWRVSDPRARRDAMGVGAFNLVRREALETLGGWEPQRMCLLEDVALGQRMKAAGMRQRIAVGPDLVLVHWAKGMRGVIRATTKNFFSGVNFHALLLLVVCVLFVALFLAPVAGVGWWVTMPPSVLILCCVGACYRLLGRWSGIDARYGWVYPVGAAAVLWAMVRSMVSAWVRRGVMWRGTFYPLRELKRYNSPWQWERSARKARTVEEAQKRESNRLLALWPALRRKRKNGPRG